MAQKLGFGAIFLFLGYFFPIFRGRASGPRNLCFSFFFFLFRAGGPKPTVYQANGIATLRERKMRTNFFCTNFLNTTRGPGHPGKIPGTSRIPLFETQGRQSFEGGHEVFGHHPFAWKTPTPPGGLRSQNLNLCALFSCLNSRVPNGILRNFSLPERWKLTN